MRYLLILLLLTKFCCSRAQNVTVGITMPSVALLDLLGNGSTDFTLSSTAPSEAGNSINTTSSNLGTWLIFTSAIASGFSRSIKGDVSGTLPPGIRLRLDISPYTGSGQGFTGGNSIVTGNVYLTNTATSFIDNIKGAFTGIAYGSDGFKLKYSLEVQTYADIRSGTSVLTVRYTIVDN
ncbi:hypothetical protein [Dyadobacter frigoris]|uniref:DUF4402 domain-containing protein n=1 Tax=Dyadobacter frigoris TaxID=2576211 RepID=A0A4U6D170_9BACT|nr:hypothetical protein [Dyadobacter frigoris]TKT90949.1 hypothetical protein FDK13_18485 [Dyadobacter frigoris]GLU56136.1 hypothetical protein Dfri01_55970 [Dyadobacter frigoris]